MIFDLGHISLSLHTCYVVRDGALGIGLGGATHFIALWKCVWGRGDRGNNATFWALALLSREGSLSYHHNNPHRFLQPEALILYFA